MLSHMRTTVRLPDELYRSVQKRAAEEGRSVTAFIAHALREQLATSPAASEREPFVIDPFAGTGTVAGVDLSDSADLLERMEG